MAPTEFTRKPLSVRTRFEVFKRDDFTCTYCGRSSPTVVLEVDHMIPVCDGGSEDPINLTTSCWDCNHGKAGVALNQVMTGEDPHDRAIRLLETERQLREYNEVLAAYRERRNEDVWELLRYWTNDETLNSYDRREVSWLRNVLESIPVETIRGFMDAAFRAGATRDLRYVKGCVRTLRGQVGAHG